ncbi:hypothetical protein [Hymenobacter weizhouensis]|uniref:hypothetical protein n=1 Tax=Hymenobacter sp. YIM 151500-1 TaxID=2987689 RepID=UPI00222696A9|nr:hypothetical protein [Hymenobacter sp. YIM 151500-1]UYZ65090.1 hypothetical protein OIS53_09600 [Hymenobacter sp. YIM 151500-1]
MGSSSWLLIADYVEIAAYGSLSIPTLVALSHWRQLSAPLRMLACVPAYMLLLFVLMRLTAYLGQHNIWLAHFSAIGESLLYIGTFALALPHLRRWVPLLIAGFLAAAALDSFVLEGTHQLNSYTIALESFLGILLVLLYFEREINTPSRVLLLERPLIVASIGIVLYLAGTVTVYLISNSFVLANDIMGMTLLYSVNSVLLLLLSGLFTYAFRLASLARPYSAFPGK